MKLNKKLTSILVTGAMIASIGGTTAMTSFAADTTPKVTAITKTFQMPVGTTTPDVSFTYNFKAVEGYGSNADLTTKTFTKTIAFDEDDGVATGDVKTVTKSTDAIFGTKDAEVVFPHAGRYAFEATELIGNETGVTYDYAKYTLYVAVANLADGSGTYVKDITAGKQEADTNEDGTPKTDEEGNIIYKAIDKALGNYEFEDKDNDDVVDQFEEDNGTPADENDKNDEDAILAAQTGNGFGYTNTYVKATNVTPDGKDEDGEDPDATDDNTGLYIQKNVAGDFADKTQEFTFSVTVTAPSLSNKTEYKAVIFDLDEDKTVGDEKTFASGVAQEIKLTDQQRLVFKDLDIGAKYEVTEAAAANYTAAVNGEATNAASDTIVDTEANQARYVNTYDDEGTTPTGILMQNAPYILVATLAAGGLVIYLAKRREEEEEA